MDELSVIEAALEVPRQVLALRHRAKGEPVGEMKAQGVEYDKRMHLLEEI